MLTEQKLSDCRTIYLGQNGRDHALIEFKMRLLGHRFSRRALYGRTDKQGKFHLGLIEGERWKPELTTVIPKRGRYTRRAASAPQAMPRYAFREFLQATAPGMSWDRKHQLLLYKYLERISNGESKRLMIFMPPRHGKSELVTTRYAAWRLWQNPKMRIVIGSYSQHLANKFSRSIRRVLSEEEDKLERINRNAQDKDYIAIEPSANPAPRKRGQPKGTADDRSETDAASASSSSSVPKPGRVFPPSRNINTMGEWETSQGGGVKAVGVGAGITGFGAELMIIDDPVKSRAEAESKTYRDRVWDWFRDDVCTRLEPDAPMILIQTRWHEDDLAGRILADREESNERWDVLSLPAIAETKGERIKDEGERAAAGNADAAGNAGDPACMSAQGEQIHRDEEDKMDKSVGGPRVSKGEIETEPTRVGGPRVSKGSFDQDKENGSCSSTKPQLDPPNAVTPASRELYPSSLILHPSDDFRLPGEALWPERFPSPVLLDRKRRIGSYAFAALYQQTPSPAEGGILKREWFTNIVDKLPSMKRWARAYDLAVSTRTTADYTASFLVGVDWKGNYFIADGFRKRIEFPEQRRYVLERMREEKHVIHGVEDALHGKALVQDIQRETDLGNVTLRSVRVDSDKVTRALAWASRAENGKLFLLRGGWIGELVDEVASFPNGSHDDQIDAISLAISLLAETENRSEQFRGYGF